MRPITETDIILGLEAIARGEPAFYSAPQRAPAPVRQPKTPVHVARQPVVRDWLIVGTGEAPREPSLAVLMQAVSDRTAIGIVDLRSPRRFKNIVRARMIFYALAKRLTSRSLPQIGIFIGNKDHSTVLHGIQRVAENKQEFEPELSELLAVFQPHARPETP